VGSLRRVATEEVTVLGMDFPKGTIFQVYIRAIHMNPKYWSDPKLFLPERFNEVPSPGSFIPFGDGMIHS
jgi:cytochrome P450